MDVPSWTNSKKADRKNDYAHILLSALLAKAMLFDLAEVLRDLRAEAHPAEHGHRQITIFQRTPITQVIFAFEPSGELTDHMAHGLVIIHALEGQLVVQADGHDHELRAGYILVLNPDVRHNVRALEASAMLLTVHLEGEK